MKKTLFIALFLFSGILANAQTMKNAYIGMNVFQLASTTLNVNYSVDLNSYFTPMIDIGYTFNQEKSFNYPKPTNKEYDGYRIDKRSGSYLKIGTLFNFTKDLDKKGYFHLGLFFTNSIVYEKGIWETRIRDENIEQNAYLMGVSSLLGYERSLAKRLKASLDFQLSFPNKTYKEMLGTRNFIPGMGYQGMQQSWFPMLIFNVKYRV